MMKEKKIRTILPFLLVLASTFFLSDADPFENFGTRFEFVKYNIRLIWLLFLGDAGQSVIWFCCSLIFFRAWRKNRDTNKWYSDLHWQLSGIFFCWSVLSILSVVSNLYSYLWIQGMVRLFVFFFGFYFLNTLYRVRKILYNPETPDTIIEKAKKLDDLLVKIDDLVKKNKE
jgi:hypothetical protein